MDWVVFDYGEVISKRTTALPALAQRYGVARDEFEPVYFAERPPYDRGCPAPDYWRAIGEHFSRPVDAALAAELTELDVHGWLEAEPDSLRLLDELAEAGTGLALLSNAPPEFGRAAERQPWARHFAEVVFSGDLHLVKPEPEIWAVLLDRLGARAADCLFFDDRPENVDGAREAGMHAERWQDAATARRVLRGCGVLPATSTR